MENARFQVKIILRKIDFPRIGFIEKLDLFRIGGWNVRIFQGKIILSKIGFHFFLDSELVNFGKEKKSGKWIYFPRG